MMTMLTTRQRDILLNLLEANAPMATAKLAEELQLSPRQINYDLRGIRRWLEAQGVLLQSSRGSGVAIQLQSDQQIQLVEKLNSSANVQLILNSDQRLQLLTFIFLTADEPIILYQLQQLFEVSRTTILKDIDEMTDWLNEWQILLERRQNCGFWLECSELVRRQAIAALLWGKKSLKPPFVEMNHEKELVFPLGRDAGLLQAVQVTAEIICSWDMRRAAGQVTYIETQLGGRFTDNGVLYLALVLAIQTQRVQGGKITAVAQIQRTWLKTLPIWPVAARIAKPLDHSAKDGWPEDEIALIVMYILATPRYERWPNDLALDITFFSLIDHLVAHIVEAYEMPNLAQDKTLRDGLINHIIPACFRQRFGLWLPPLSKTTALSEKYIFEHELAQRLGFIRTLRETG